MGMYFSNLHIRKNRQITIGSIQTHITELMTAQQFLPVSSEEEADGAFAIATSEASQWYSVYSDLFFFDTPKVFTDRAQPMSHVLRTDILGIPVSYWTLPW